MEAIRIEEFVRDLDDIKVSRVPRPQAKDDEVIVQIIAAGVNFVDILYARGKHQNNRSLVRPPFILGLEFAGIVISAPPSSKYSPGDRVFGGGLGSYAEQIAVKETSLHHIPNNWDFRDAAGLAATAPVSYGALIVRGKLQRGETVLIHASAGGLGSMAVQISKAVGARVIATAGSTAKLDVAKGYGADKCINYSSNPEWWKEVLGFTNGAGVDVVYDPVGLVDRSLKCVKQKGRILIVGFAGTEGNIERIATNRILLKQAQIIGYRFGMTDRIDPGETAEIWKGLKDMLEPGLLRPTVFDCNYRGLESVVSAMKDLQARKVWGKAVVLLESGHQGSRL
ncbi:quinone oxidoreductase [Stipitochalara longipes BDJ]|nr:quinone oxidoreductase [Stipitochalara longipes BDJ]